MTTNQPKRLYKAGTSNMWSATGATQRCGHCNHTVPGIGVEIEGGWEMCYMCRLCAGVAGYKARSVK